MWWSSSVDEVRETEREGGRISTPEKSFCVSAADWCTHLEATSISDHNLALVARSAFTILVIGLLPRYWIDLGNLHTHTRTHRMASRSLYLLYQVKIYRYE